MISFVSRH